MNLDELKAMTFSEIEHSGVKGMKWGKRKATGVIDSRPTDNTVFNDKRDKNWKKAPGPSAILVYAIGKKGDKKEANKIIEKSLNISVKDIDKKSLKNAQKIILTFDAIELKTSGTKWTPVNNIEHSGVKGMKWGKRKAETTSSKKKEPGKIKKELSSFKREVSTRKDLKNLSKMSEKDIKARTTRLRNENDLKRLSDRGEYLNRAKLSDTKLQSRINRLRLEDNLAQQIKGANKDNVALANKIITETAKFALTAYTGTVGIQVADSIIKESIKYASQNKVIKQSLDMTPSEVLLMHSGVKGMKWGVRKDNPTTSKEGITSNKKKQL